MQAGAEANNDAAITFGLCGLGNVGTGIASRLAQAGTVIAYDVDPAHLQAASDAYGIRSAKTMQELAEADIIMLSLPDPQVSIAVIEELVKVLPQGRVVIEMSTVNATDIYHEQVILEPRGVGLADAAVIGGVKGMYDGVATLLIGGDPEVLRRAQPALDAITQNQLKLGPLGSGMAAKVINNAVAHSVMVVLVEAFALASATGVSPELLIELLQRPDAGLLRPLTHRIAERVLRDNFDGGMPMQAARKDSTLALQLARETGVPLFATQAAHTVYEIGLGSGLGRKDYASIAQLWDSWTDRIPVSRAAGRTERTRLGHRGWPRCGAVAADGIAADGG